MNSEVKLRILINTSDMYNFLLKHTYSNVYGVIGIVLSLSSLVYLSLSYQQNRPLGNAILLVIGLLFTVVNPLILFYKAKYQIRNNPIFKEPLEYCMNMNEILVKQESQQVQIDWEEIDQVVETKCCIIIYISNIRAYIFPKSKMSGEYEAFMELIMQRVDTKKLKLKNKRVS